MSARRIRLPRRQGRCDGCGHDAVLWLDLCGECWGDDESPPRHPHRSWFAELRRAGLPRFRVDEALVVVLLSIGVYVFVIALWLGGIK